MLQDIYFPLRKDYELIVKIKKWWLFWLFDKKVIIKYKQATFEEMIIFINNQKDLWKRLIEFLRKNSNCNNRSLKYLLQNSDIILNDLNNRYLYINRQNKEIKNIDEDKDSINTPFSSYLLNICKESNEKPRDLIAYYTLEQIMYLTKGILWNINEMTKEGKAKNRNESSKQNVLNMSESRKKEIDDLLSKIT